MKTILTARIVVFAIVFGGFGVEISYPQENDGRLPVPAGNELEEARLLVEEVYRQEYERARTSARKQALAKKILEGAKGRESAANRFVMLRTARIIAAQAGAAELALRAADEIASRYQLEPGNDAHESAALKMKLAALMLAAQKAGLVEQHRGVVQQARFVQDQAVRGKRFALAQKLGECALAAARRARDADLTREVVARNKQVEELGKALSEVNQVLAKLEENPNDPEANLVAGRHFGLIKGDWKRALPMLALGADEKLKALALKELDGIADPAEQVAIGDGWRELARATEGVDRKHLMSRAYGWYRTALPQLIGLRKARLAQRMQEMEADVPGVAEGLAGKISPPSVPMTELAEKVIAPVEQGLKWLAEHQYPDGSWNYDHTRCPSCQGKCPNPGDLREAPRGATAQALLPFLGAGQAHTEGNYKGTVKKGLDFLVRSMKVRGGTGSLEEPGGRMYAHGMGAIVLCEAYAMTRDKGLLQPAQLSLNHISYAQDPVGGGWRYTPKQPGDTSVSGWQLTALSIGADAGLKVPPQTIAGATKFLDSVQSNSGSHYGYTGPDAGRQATTAIGLLCRMELGWKKDHQALQEGIRFLANVGPSESNLYYNYFASAVMARYGGDTAKQWCNALSDDLITAQSKNGDTAGSWYSGTDYGTAKGGRLYCTTMALMALQNCSKCPD